MHPRKKIRKAIVARLQADQRVVPLVDDSRVLPIALAKLPRIGVYTTGERVVGILSEAPRLERRVLDVGVEIHADAESSETTQDFADDLAEQIERVVLEDETQLGVAERTEYRDTKTTASTEGDRVIVGVVLGFDVTYVREHLPVELPDATGMDVDIDIESETAGQIEAQAKVELPTT